MRNKILLIKSLVVIAIGAIVTMFCLGMPEENQQLIAKVNSYIGELYQTVNGSDGDRAAFLTNGFCFNGTLEKLAIEAKDVDEITLVENLGRDCRIIIGLLQS